MFDEGLLSRNAQQELYNRLVSEHGYQNQLKSSIRALGQAFDSQPEEPKFNPKLLLLS